MTVFHPNDGIARPLRLAWYVAAGVDCPAFDKDAWRQLELERLGLIKTKAKAASGPVVVGKRRRIK